jgi:hypothetical protein
MCYKNAQVQNHPTLKWGTCHNGKYMVASKLISNLNIDALPKPLKDLNVNLCRKQRKKEASGHIP